MGVAWLSSTTVVGRLGIGVQAPKLVLVLIPGVIGHDEGNESIDICLTSLVTYFLLLCVLLDCNDINVWALVLTAIGYLYP